MNRTFTAPKKDTKQIIKTLRQAGLQVDEIDGGYECIGTNGNVLFKAMVEGDGYSISTLYGLFVYPL